MYIYRKSTEKVNKFYRNHKAKRISVVESSVQCRIGIVYFALQCHGWLVCGNLSYWTVNGFSNQYKHVLFRTFMCVEFSSLTYANITCNTRDQASNKLFMIVKTVTICG